MTTILLITAVLQSQIPGAVNITAVVNNTRTGLGIVSDTGGTMFKGANRIERFPLMAHGGPVGDEDLFFLLDDGRPFSLTTSQFAHYQQREGEIGLRRSHTETRVLAAPDDDTVLCATLLEDGSMRLSVVNLAERGNRPNVDYQIRNVGENLPVGVAARWVDGKPVWYIHYWNRGAPGRIERCEVENGQIVRTVVGNTPLGMPQPLWFDPESGVAVTAVHTPNVIDVAAINSTTFRTVPKVGYGAARPFLWRGDVFLKETKSKLTYKLNSMGEWDVFCNYYHLASSENGKYWVVRDAVGQSFLVEFGPE